MNAWNVRHADCVFHIARKRNPDPRAAHSDWTLMDLDVSTTANFKPAPATDLDDQLLSTPEVEVRDDRKRPRRSLITLIATTASRRWKGTLAFFIVVVLAGGYSFGFGLDREGFPPINTPISIVTGTYFVDDIDQVDADVTQPLVDAFDGVDGVVATEAQARPSSFVVVVEFDDSLGSEEGT
ncbi:MAG: hypothetical protein GKR86_11095, partial [Ilumatobacter sp.]|nr:hypothetical protein [Ilumatobacter sp.]